MPQPRVLEALLSLEVVGGVAVVGFLVGDRTGSRFIGEESGIV